MTPSAPLFEVTDLHVAVFDEAYALAEPDAPQLRVEHDGRTLAAGWRRAVRGVSFGVREGEVLAIVGESGGGKTLSSLSAFSLNGAGSYVTAGSARFDGHTILPVPKKQQKRRWWRRYRRERDIGRRQPRYFEDHDEEWRRLIGMEVGFLFQDAVTAWDPAILIGDQSGEVLAEHTDMSRDEIESRVMDALGEVHLPKTHKFFSFAHELSRGQAQRAMLAAALIKAPKLLVADEPLSGLDAAVAASVLDLIRDLQARRGMAMVLITHDLATVVGIADRVAVMYGGQIVEEGPTADVFRRPQHPYTDGLLGSIPWPGVDRLRPIDGSPSPLTEVPEEECAFAARCSFAIEACRTHRPPLVAGAGERRVACVRATSLDLPGVGA